METVDVALIKDGRVANIVVLDPTDKAYRAQLAKDYQAVVDLPSQADHVDPNKPNAVRPSAGWDYKPNTAAKFTEPPPVHPEDVPVSEAVDALLANDPDYAKLTAAQKPAVARIVERHFGGYV